MKKKNLIPGVELIQVFTVLYMILRTQKGCTPGVGMEGAAYRIRGNTFKILEGFGFIKVA